jgi:hypothetical protein
LEHTVDPAGPGHSEPTDSADGSNLTSRRGVVKIFFSVNDPGK